MKTQEKSRRKKSLMITLGVHSALLVLAMVPVTYHLQQETEDVFSQLVTIEFAEFAQSSDKALKAKSPIQEEEVKPVTEEINNEPDIVEAEIIEEVTEATAEVEPIESEVTEQLEMEVAASEDEKEGVAEEDASMGGTEATAEHGNTEGTDESGDSEGHQGLDGTGVITRKVIHREDITQVARYSGVISVNLCIDRRGHVTAVSSNEERTTIEDVDLLRRALDIATGYRFETDYTAAIRECGVLTFVFDIEEDNYTDYVFVE